MAIMDKDGGKVDPRFNAINVMEKFGWTFQQYAHRPSWFDPLYAIKIQAEEKKQEIEAPKTDGHK